MTDRSYLPPEHVDLLQTPPAVAYPETPERVGGYPLTTLEMNQWLHCAGTHQELMAMVQDWDDGKTMDTEQRARFRVIRDGYPR
jgi:hypothetical protein